MIAKIFSIKLVLVILLLPFVSLVGFSKPALAINDCDRHAVLYNTDYFDPCTCQNIEAPDLSGGGGSGPLFGLKFPEVSDLQDLADRIDKFIKNTAPRSPLVGLGADFVAAGKKYDVNPAMLVGFANKESTLATAQQPVVTSNHNSFGMTGVDGYPTVNGFAAFPSFKESLDPATKYVANTYVHGGFNSKTLLQLMEHYTPPSPERDTRLTLAVMHKILDGISTESSTPAESGNPAQGNAPNTSLQLDKIASKYSLQSAIVKKLGGEIIDKYKETTPPNSPASVLKLIIADVFLSTNPNLDKKVTVSNSELYGGPGSGSGDAKDPKAGQQLTLKDALIQTLMNSSDTDANILINELGGPSVVTSKAHLQGYTATDVNAYYDGSATVVRNSTTVKDLTDAMEKIFTHSENIYKVAQDALRNDTNTFGIDSAANKWGGVSGESTGKPATGNSALVEIGGDQYIITMYINEPWTGDDSKSVRKIRDATTEIISSLNQNPEVDPGAKVDNCVEQDNPGQNSFQGTANGFNLTGANAMAHFYQCDPKWGDKPYGSGKDSICHSGCGITSLTMVVDTLANKNETPATLSDKYGDRYHVAEGTSWSLWPKAADDYNLEYTDLGVDLNKARDIIKQGGLVIISVNAGYFTSGGHLMVLRAVDDQGNFFIADPNGPGNKAKGHDTEGRSFSADFLRTTGSLYHLFGFTKKQ